MATVKKNEKSGKAKASSSKTGRSPALKPKEKTAAAKKATTTSTRARTVSKPASKKTATTKTPTKAAASRARSTATRQRTVATPVPARSAARGAAVRTAPVKDSKKKAETAKTKATAAKVEARTASAKAGAKAAATQTAATKVKAAAKSKAKAVAADKAKTSPAVKTATKPVTAKPVAAAAKPVVAKPTVKSPVAAKAVKKPEVAKVEAPSKAEVKLTSAKSAKKVDAAAPAKNDSVSPKKIAEVPAPAEQTILTKPAKAEPAPKAAELIELAPKTSADHSAETQTDSASLNSVASKLPTADSSVVRPAEPVAAIAKKAEEKIMIGKAAKTSAPTDTAASLQEAKLAKPAEVKSEKPVSKPAAKATPGKGFKVAEFIVYPAHGVGEIIAIEEQEVAGFKLELFVISFIKDKMILKVPVTKVAAVGMRKLAESGIVKKALDTLMGRARIKRTMWSRRAQEYEAKINSGDLVAIAEVVRDLYRSDAQPEQSYSERQLYEAALDRLAREVGTVQKLTETEALKVIESQLQKGPRRTKADEIEADLDGAETEDGEIEEAA